jgi:regulator of protease activity HflC (stomatin/prohibitin superfamily)
MVSTVLGPLLVALVIVLVALIASTVKIAREYERGVIFRLGRLMDYRGPGVVFIVPILVFGAFSRCFRA